MTNPAHKTLLSPIPEEERASFIRDTFSRWDSGPHHGNSPASTTVEAYAQWKIDASDAGKTPRLFGNMRWPRTCEHCQSECVYCGNYCVRPSCPRSIEMHDLVYAVRSNDLVKTLRLASMVFPNVCIDELAEFVRVFIYLKEGKPAGTWEDEVADGG